MRLQNALSKVEAWRTEVLAASAPLLARAREELIAAQMEPDADERIAHQEELVTAGLDDILLDAEHQLESVKEEVAQFFESVDDASEEEQNAADGVDRAPDVLREWLTRKVSSIVAQARAQELVVTGTTSAVVPQSEAVPMAASERSTTAADAPLVRPLRQARPTQVGYGSPEELAKLYGPPMDQASGQAPLKRFCTECGGPLGPDAGAARTCPTCGPRV